MKSLRESLSLPVPTVIVEAQQLIKDTIRTFADYLRLEPSIKDENALLVTAKKNLEK